MRHRMARRMAQRKDAKVEGEDANMRDVNDLQVSVRMKDAKDKMRYSSFRKSRLTHCSSVTRYELTASLTNRIRFGLVWARFIRRVPRWCPVRALKKSGPS
jgi:hypothetical protein